MVGIRLFPFEAISAYFQGRTLVLGSGLLISCEVQLPSFHYKTPTPSPQKILKGQMFRCHGQWCLGQIRCLGVVVVVVVVVVVFDDKTPLVFETFETQSMNLVK